MMLIEEIPIGEVCGDLPALRVGQATGLAFHDAPGEDAVDRSRGELGENEFGWRSGAFMLVALGAVSSKQDLTRSLRRARGVGVGRCEPGGREQRDPPQ